LEYNITLDMLAVTPKTDTAYIDRWMDLEGVSEQLHKAQCLEQLHLHDCHRARYD
jgi:hypothetical protein